MDYKTNYFPQAWGGWNGKVAIKKEDAALPKDWLIQFVKIGDVAYLMGTSGAIGNVAGKLLVDAENIEILSEGNVEWYNAEAKEWFNGKELERED